MLRLGTLLGCSAVLSLCLVGGATAYAEDEEAPLRIVGSSTVAHFASLVAERMQMDEGIPAPLVESTGTGGGVKIFCSSALDEDPDIVMASRSMTDKELAYCAEHGIEHPIRITVGLDGMVIATARGDQEPMAITTRNLFLALAKEIPQDGAWVANPYTRWQQIDPELPDIAIRFYAPPPSSGTRDVFESLALERGCDEVLKEQGMEADTAPDTLKRCRIAREDGLFSEIGENDNLAIAKIEATPGALAVFGYTYFVDNKSKIHALAVNGVNPEEQTLHDGRYPLVRPLYLYLKPGRQHVASVQTFVRFFVMPEAIAEGGYLAQHGLVDTVRTPEEQTLIGMFLEQ